MAEAKLAGLTQREVNTHDRFEQRCLLITAMLLLVAAWISIGFHQYDEHFQLLEYANFKLGWTPVADLPWEYAARIRSWFQPAVAVVVRETLLRFGDSDPFHAAIVLRLCSGLLYWTALVRMVRCSRPWFGSPEIRRLAIAVACCLWFVPYLAVRFSGESWSGSLFFLGLASLIQEAQGEPVSAWELGWAGIAMGLAFAARYQSAILIIAALVWFRCIGRGRVSSLVAVISGVVVVFAGSLVLDRWGYGAWTLTPWNYLHANLLQGVAAHRFGVSPWWWYFTRVLISAGLPIGLLLVAGMLAAWWKRPANPLSWVTLSFVLAHSLLGHKELRFLFPLLLAVPLLVVLSLEAFPTLALWALHSRAGRVLVAGLFLLNGVGLMLRLAIPARSEIGLQRAAYYNGTAHLLLVPREDPYVLGGLRSDIYRRPGLVTAALTDSAGGLDTAEMRQPFLIAEKLPFTADLAQWNCQVLYRSFPEWVERDPVWSRLQWAEPSAWTLVRCLGRTRGVSPPRVGRRQQPTIPPVQARRLHA